MEETSLFRSKSSGESTVSSSSSSVTSAPDHFEPVNIEVVDNYSFGLQLRGVGISVVNSSSQVGGEVYDNNDYSANRCYGGWFFHLGNHLRLYQEHELQVYRLEFVSIRQDQH